MSDAVSILSAPDGRPLALRVAAALAAQGYSVLHGKAGAGGPLVAVWSEAAAADPAIVAAAQAALAARRLIPVSAGAIALPEPLARHAPIDLAGWTGDDDARWRFALEEVAAALERPGPAAAMLYDDAEPGALFAEDAPPETDAPAPLLPVRMIAVGAVGLAALALAALVAAPIAGADRRRAGDASANVYSLRLETVLEAPSDAPPPEPQEEAAAAMTDASPPDEAPRADGSVADLAAEDASVLEDIPPAADEPPAALTPRFPPPAPDDYLGVIYRDCVDCPDMTEIAGEGARAGFAVARREITRADWRRCVREGACLPLPDDAAQDGALPAAPLSRMDAERYLRWLSMKSGRRYRLPTEEEWGRAAGVGPLAGNFDGALVAEETGEVVRAPAPAGRFPANRNGLFDLGGNVWEWTAGCAPEGGPACTRGVLLGGAFDTARADGLAVPRLEQPAGERLAGAGLRPVRALD